MERKPKKPQVLINDSRTNIKFNEWMRGHASESSLMTAKDR